MTSPLADTIPLKSIIYSLSKWTSKDLYSLQVSLHDSKTTSQMYSKNFFKIKRSNGNVYTLCHVVWLLTLTSVYLSVNVLYLNEKLFKFEVISSTLCSFCNSENETPIHLFYSCSQTKSLWSESQENSEILLPQNTPQSAFFIFPDDKENFEIIKNHLHLIIKCYLFKSRDTRKISLEGLKKGIIKIYNIEKHIVFRQLEKRNKV